ncbi:hypothetical protein ACFQ88_28610 [Paenibacillus sp. NPDC056579]|uniref:hypothetical protein n=1 Tax=unclassified Paenibacillus TaxID=185978 RepID=UPI001EF981CF|nr:hypothetical protein [Paenibacillus sp. H1-7]ULL19166.1 hypothetical protein DVH26_34955 [Paenibacillus sp. H1-7]
MVAVYAAGLLLGGLFLINGIFSYQGKYIEPVFWPTFWYQLKLLPLIFAANLMIGFGIQNGYRALGNLTITLLMSKCLEMLVCVVIGYIFLKEIPTWKTFLGLAVIAGGFLITRWK